MDFGNFLQQVFPIVSFYIIIPILLLALYFGIRQIRRRTVKANENNLAKSIGAKQATKTAKATRYDDEPSALDLLARARIETDEEEDDDMSTSTDEDMGGDDMSTSTDDDMTDEEMEDDMGDDDVSVEVDASAEAEVMSDEEDTTNQ